MEDRKLNLGAPLLSVRRVSATPLFTNAEAGRVTPRLANGRHTLPIPRSDFSLEQVTKPVAVPFHWEEIPGRSKEGDEESNVISRVKASINVKNKPIENEQADHKAILPYLTSISSAETAAEVHCPKLENEDDVYSDAHESFSMNCSAVGTCHSQSANVRPSIDPQTQDFMMKRFLPAAKAMALETPHVAIKRQQQYTAPLEKPRQVTRVVRKDTTHTSPSPNQKWSNMELVLYGQYKEEVETEGEEDEDDIRDHITQKGCGLFPRLGLRNSLCPLPVPAMKSKARALISCSSGVGMPGKASTKTIRDRSHSQPLKQVSMTTKSQSHSQEIKSHMQPLNKAIKPAISQQLNKDAVHNVKVDCRFYSGELPRLTNQTAHTNLFRHSGEQPKGKSSPFRQSRSPCISPYRNERPKLPLTGSGYLGVPKEDNVKANSSKFNMNDKVGHKSHEVLSHHRNKQGPYTVIPMIEKTLYVDTVNTTKARVDSAVEDLRIMLKRSGMEETSKEESFFQDIKCLTNFESNAALVPVEDTSLSSLSEKSHIKGQLGFDTRDDDIIKDDPGNSIVVVQCPLPPPLPKSPSQSWLSSTLSSTPSRTISVSASSKRHTKRLHTKASSSGTTKWETIVKTSNLHHDHVRYSEELITHACHQPKS